jgi:hypothetical protein
LSDKKILISGCGISWSGQERKTWVNIFKVAGLDITDVGGPAVSNQWILNRAIEYLLSNTIDIVIIQLTSLGKLDVEVNESKYAELVSNDTLRDFTIDGIWPSSYSLEHQSKQLWAEWLYSPRLELQDIKVKLELLKFYCQTKDITLLVLEGYGILPEHTNIIYNDYIASDDYKCHDHTDNNAVPCLEYQFTLAKNICSLLSLDVFDKIKKIEQQYRYKRSTNNF